MSPRVIDDLGTEVEEPRRAIGTIVTLVVLVLGIAVISSRMESRVEESLRITEGEWQLESSNFPAWIPPHFSGTLAELGVLPAQVPLRSANWRRRVARALEENPWIEQVEQVDRSAEGITFRARFLRPVLAVRARDGYLLLDSVGRVIDTEPARELDVAWNLPLLLPSRGDLPPLAPGTRVLDDEVLECLSLVSTLWRAGVPQRFPGELTLVESYTPAGVPGLLWRFHDRFGTQLRWGRAPSSPYAAVLPTPERLENLIEVLSVGEERRTMRAVELFEVVPLIVRGR